MPRYHCPNPECQAEGRIKLYKCRRCGGVCCEECKDLALVPIFSACPFCECESPAYYGWVEERPSADPEESESPQPDKVEEEKTEAEPEPYTDPELYDDLESDDDESDGDDESDEKDDESDEEEGPLPEHPADWGPVILLREVRKRGGPIR